MLDFFQILAEDIVAIDPSSACGGIGPIVAFVKNGIMPIIQFGVPILLIVFGSLDLGKAVMSQDDSEIKKATSKLVRRIVVAVVVFFVPFIVNLVMSLIGKAGSAVDGNTSWIECWNNPE